VKRINIAYDGAVYSIGEQEFAEYRERITAAHAQNAPFWLRVNYGEGRPQPADLLIAPGIPIALIPIAPGVDDLDHPEPDPEDPSDHGTAPDDAD